MEHQQIRRRPSRTQLSTEDVHTDTPISAAEQTAGEEEGEGNRPRSRWYITTPVLRSAGRSRLVFRIAASHLVYQRMMEQMVMTASSSETIAGR